MKKYAVIAVAALLAACGSDFEGTYKDPQGISSYAFKSGKVVISAKGINLGAEMDYKVEDGKVKIVSPQGTIVMDILQDGSISGPLGLKLTKQK